MAVAIAYALGTAVERDRSAAVIVLAGVAVAAFLTAAQTYLQQEHAETLREVYSWILGRLTLASWSDVRLLLPYAVVSAVVLLLHRRLLDVLQVGEEEADALGVDARSGPPHRRDRGDAGHGGRGRGDRPDRLRRDHRRPHRAHGDEGELPGRPPALDDRRRRLPGAGRRHRAGRSRPRPSCPSASSPRSSARRSSSSSCTGRARGDERRR